MDSTESAAGELTTAHLWDACLRARVDLRCVALYPVVPGSRLAGPVLPVRHFGSVDVFLEAIDSAVPGSILVVDNGGRRDEACIGDLVTLEAARAGLGGIVIWGYHRDTVEIRALGLPLFSLGAFAAGPTRLDPRTEDVFSSAAIGDFSVSAADFVVADDDGALFIPSAVLPDVVRKAEGVREQERLQAERAKAGISLRAQLQLADYVAKRTADPEITFRRHLRAISGAIEE